MSNTKPHYTGHRSRLRERFLASPKGALPDYELLELLLFAAYPRCDVKPKAKALIAEFGSLAKLLNTPLIRLQQSKSLNNSSLSLLKAVQEIAERLITTDIQTKPLINHWKALEEYCLASMGHLTTEQFRILYLDHKHQLIADKLQETGTINHTPVYIREVVKQALYHDASGLVLVHNHPSGDLTPSKADISITQDIKHALKTVEITLFDHLIVSCKGCYSFHAHGLL